MPFLRGKGKITTIKVNVTPYFPEGETHIVWTTLKVRCLAATSQATAYREDVGFSKKIAIEVMGEQASFLKQFLVIAKQKH
jgi:hypothetical protein